MMKVKIAYTETCLPDYFSGDSRPWVALYPSEKGYTSRELREYISSEFSLGAVGGSDPLLSDFIVEEKDRVRADKFYSKALPACLNRDIKFRGKAHNFKDYDIKQADLDDCSDLPLLHIVFDIEE